MDYNNNKQCLSSDLIWSKMFCFGDGNLKLTLNYSEVFHARYTHYPVNKQKYLIIELLLINWIAFVAFIDAHM